MRYTAQFNLPEAISLLERAPAVFNALLLGLPDSWTQRNEGGDTWSAFENCDGVRQVELCSVSHGCVDVRRRAFDLKSEGETGRKVAKNRRNCLGKVRDKIKRLRHWLCSSCQLLRGSQAAWRHAPSQPLMRSLLSQFQTPTAPRRAVGFFGFGSPASCPADPDHPVYFGWPRFILANPFNRRRRKR